MIYNFIDMKNSKFLIVISFFAIYVVWGSTYLFNKIAVTELSPFFLASIRFSVAGILMIFLAFILKQPLKITKKQFFNSMIASFFFLIYGNGVFVWALRYVDSGFGALMASTQPLFVLFLLRLIDRKPFQKKSIIGVILGMFGMYLLVSQKELITSEGTLLGVFMILTCVLSWSYGSVFVSKYLQKQLIKSWKRICIESRFTKKFYGYNRLPNVGGWFCTIFSKFKF